MTELWRPCPDFEGIYEVSDTGRVRSLYVDPPRLWKEQAIADVAQAFARHRLAAEAAAIERLQSPIAWCIEQAGEIMAISSGCADTHGDPGGGLQMINSIASDIAINLQMTGAIPLKEGASHVG